MTKIGFDQNGINKETKEKYDKKGYNQKGFNKDGINKYGKKYDFDGYDVNGYNENGYNRQGYNCEGEYEENHNEIARRVKLRRENKNFLEMIIYRLMNYPKEVFENPDSELKKEEEQER